MRKCRNWRWQRNYSLPEGGFLQQVMVSCSSPQWQGYTFIQLFIPIQWAKTQQPVASLSSPGTFTAWGPPPLQRTYSGHKWRYQSNFPPNSLAARRQTSTPPSVESYEEGGGVGFVRVAGSEVPVVPNMPSKDM